MIYVINHPNDATVITGTTPQEIAQTLRNARNWPANRYKIIGPTTTTSPPGAVDSGWGYAIKNADGSVTLEPMPTGSG
jgi:hypothetical protein